MTVFDDLHEPIVNLKYAHSTIISLVKDGNISLYQFTDGKISHTLKLKCPVAPSPLPSDLSLSYSLSIHNVFFFFYFYFDLISRRLFIL